MGWMLRIPQYTDGDPSTVAPEDFSKVAGKALKFHGVRIERDNPGGYEQAVDAVTAASHLINSGVLGKQNNVYVVLSGHANPGHTPPEGYYADHITVSVYADPPDAK